MCDFQVSVQVDPPSSQREAPTAGVGKLSVKSQTVNIVDLQAIVSVETTQLCHWSVKAATIDTKMNKHACALRKLSL